MEDEELLLLLRKYQENRLSADEYFRLRAWVDESPGQRFFMENFIKMYKLKTLHEAVRQIDVSQAWQAFSVRCRNRRWRMIRYRVVAACFLGVILMAACFCYNVFYPKMESPKLSELLQHHGYRKAVMTLADGEKIEVNDSMMAITEELLSSVVRTQKQNEENSEVKKEKLNEVAVPRGGEFSLILPDGTKVWINSESILSFPSRFSDTRRVLLQGEAYFDVAETGSPFEVKTPNMTVRVLGTQFNISAYQSAPALATLVQGGVEVECVGGKVQLCPGQQAEILSEDSSIEVRNVNVSMYTAWVTGIFDFNDTSLEDIMSQLSRWYNVKVEFMSPALRRLHFSGTIMRKESLGYALEIIQKVSEVQFVKEKDLIRVEKK